MREGVSNNVFRAWMVLEVSEKFREGRELSFLMHRPRVRAPAPGVGEGLMISQ